MQLQEEYQKKVYCILQLRLHENVIALKKTLLDRKQDEPIKVDLSYITSRGKWYHISWKGDEVKSGGIATNIGVHFFDLLVWLFGNIRENEVHVRDRDTVSGFLKFDAAEVKYFLSINSNYLPTNTVEEGDRVYRSLQIGEHAFDFTKGFLRNCTHFPINVY